MSKTDIEKVEELSLKIERSGVDYSEVTLRKVFTQAGLPPDLTEKAIADYYKYRKGELSSLSTLTGGDLRKLRAEDLADFTSNYLQKGQDLVVAIYKDYLRYLDYKTEIATAYQESKDWGEVLSSGVYNDVNEAQEAFIDHIEEIYQTEIKDTKHLQELTGITHLSSYYNDAGKQVEIKGDKKQRDRAYKELEETLINARFSKYFRALETALREGATYKELLQISPTKFRLPKDFKRENSVGSDPYNAILWAIAFSYGIEGMSLIFTPSPREVAKDLEAPYSVVMDVLKLF
jgi:hypothetical protein